jgi:hypothetical protein
MPSIAGIAATQKHKIGFAGPVIDQSSKEARHLLAISF